MNSVWEALAALAGVLLIIGSLIAIFVRLTVESALASFETRLLNALDRRYVLRIEHEAMRTKRAAEEDA